MTPFKTSTGYLGLDDPKGLKNPIASNNIPERQNQDEPFQVERVQHQLV